MEISGNINDFIAQFESNASTQDSTESKVAGAIGTTLGKLEQELLDAMQSGDEVKAKQLEFQYQRSMRVWEMFQQLLRNSHDMLMNAIRNLRFS